jgi:hypothetical protein
LHFFAFSYLNPKITKNLVFTVSFGFVNLASSTTVSWGHKVVCSHGCRLLEEGGKQTNLSLPLEFDNNRESPLWGKLLLLHHSVLGVLTSDILKNRVDAISIELDGKSALEALFRDRYAKAPLIREVDVGMQVGHTRRIARVSNRIWTCYLYDWL